MEALPPAGDIRTALFGEMPIQIVWCIDHNNRLNAVEYHKSSEGLVAVTDLLLLLGRLQDIKDNTYDSTLIAGFFVPAGTTIEIYATTLHFTPISVSVRGFAALIILPEKTNKPLETQNVHAPLLLARNKGLIAHADSNLAKTGAHTGIKGPNTEIII
jgi:hypothetical protein